MSFGSYLENCNVLKEYPSPPPPPIEEIGDFWGVGQESLNSQNFIGKYEVKLNFPRGRGSQKKSFLGGAIFSGTTH